MSPSESPSFHDLHQTSYDPEGVLFRISDIHSEQVFQKELCAFVTRLSCRPVESDFEENEETIPQHDALLELEDYHYKHAPSSNDSSLNFSNLLHDLYKLQGHFSSAHFREHTELAIENKTAEKVNLQKILASNKINLNKLAENHASHDEDLSNTSNTLKEEIAFLEKKLAFLDVFITYHQKALAVNTYLASYNYLSFYIDPHLDAQPERLIDRFETATQELQKVLAYSQKANQNLLDCMPETSSSKNARKLFEKIAVQNVGENPFELVLCPGDGNLTPTTQANRWTCERLKKDLNLSLQEGHSPQPPSCVIQ